MEAEYGSAGYNRKPKLGSVLIFGAADHIGDPLAAHLTRMAPAIRLRLVTRSAEKRGQGSAAEISAG